LAPAAPTETSAPASSYLAAVGPALPFPHQSPVKDAERFRELRPRSDRSQWRPLYGRVADTFVVVAIGPEALVDPRRIPTSGRRRDETARRDRSRRSPT
jgi:hypothetical protein